MKTERVIVASRQSPLAIKQTEMAIEMMKAHYPEHEFEILELMTTGDRQQNWSLQEKGGKGLFTKELEEALLDGRAHMAIHSAKDLPTEMPEGLAIAGFLERGNPFDVLVKREGVSTPALIATGSPRRQAQIKLRYPDAEFKEIRGRVTTRLDKILNGYADATIVAAAGLERLGIEKYEGLEFETLGSEDMVPAVGQGAIAVETRADATGSFDKAFHWETGYAVRVERAFLRALGGGCHVAYAGHYFEGTLHIFHEKVGIKIVPFECLDEDQAEEAVLKVVNELGLPIHG